MKLVWVEALSTLITTTWHQGLASPGDSQTRTYCEVVMGCITRLQPLKECATRWLQMRSIRVSRKQVRRAFLAALIHEALRPSAAAPSLWVTQMTLRRSPLTLFLLIFRVHALSNTT